MDLVLPILGDRSYDKGVSFNEPPSHLIGDAIREVNFAMDDIPAGESGALVLVGTDAGLNGAIAIRGPLGIEVQAWIGKNWGSQIHYGARAVKTFKLFG